jgi:hypothetical protein
LKLGMQMPAMTQQQMTTLFATFQPDHLESLKE